MTSRFALGFFYVAGMASELTAESDAVPLVPQPVSLVAREGRFRFSADATIVARGPTAAERPLHPGPANP